MCLSRDRKNLFIIKYIFIVLKYGSVENVMFIMGRFFLVSIVIVKNSYFNGSGFVDIVNNSKVDEEMIFNDMVLVFNEMEIDIFVNEIML